MTNTSCHISNSQFKCAHHRVVIHNLSYKNNAAALHYVLQLLSVNFVPCLYLESQLNDKTVCIFFYYIFSLLNAVPFVCVINYD